MHSFWIANNNPSDLNNVLPFGDPQFGNNKYTKLLNTTIKYIIDSCRFTLLLISFRNVLTPFYFFSPKHDRIIHYSFQSSFYILYLTKIQYDLCLIYRAEYICHYSFKSLFICLFVFFSLAFFWLKIAVFVFCFVLH